MNKLVPVSRSSEILKALHDVPTAGHLKRDKMIEKMRERYYWNGVQSAVEKYCKECIACLCRKPAIPKPISPLVNIEVGNAFDLIAADICGPYSVENGNRYILVIREYLTKWPECYAIQNQETGTIAEKLEKYFSRQGIHKILLTDRNSESQLIAQVCARLGIEKRSTSAYYPQTDGQTERFNRTLNDMLSQYVSKSEKDCDKWLPTVLFAYRSGVFSTTGVSPFELLYGRKPRLPIELQVPVATENTKITPRKYLAVVRDTFESLHSDAHKAITKAQASQKFHYDEDATASEFVIGDRVLMYNPALSKGHSSKFRKPWEGPYVIIRKPRHT